MVTPPPNGIHERLKDMERRIGDIETYGSRPVDRIAGDLASLRREMSDFRQAVVGAEGHVPKLERKVVWVQRTMTGLLVSLVIVLVAATIAAVGGQ